MNTTPNRRSAVGLRSERGPVLLAIMLSTGLAAIDTTILATAVPSIVSDLGDFSMFPWLFSGYLLAQAVSVPIYSKLADTFGRKPIILIGIAVFFIASVLSGFAGSMTMLVIFRVLQGLGAGAVQPLGVTIIGDIYTVAERARVQGYIASVWAVASVIGPTLGGLFSQFASWRLIFFVNIPLCILAGWMIIRNYREERVVRQQHRVDYVGAAVLTIGLTAVILALLEGGNAWEWGSPQSLIAFGIGAVALVAFVFIERRADDPILNLSLLARRDILAPSLVGLCIGAVLIGITSFAPTYLENSIGTPPVISGLAVAAFTIGWPISAATAGRLYMRFGFRRTAILGAVVTTLGTIALIAVAPWPHPLTLGMVTFCIGLGLGWAATPAIVSAQAAVEWNKRAVVTGVNLFARSAGSAIGVAVYGAIANGIISRGAGEHDFDTIVSASQWVFVGAGATALLMIIAALGMSRRRVDEMPSA